MSESEKPNERLPDRAIADSAEDTLGREAFVNRLRGALINPKTNRSTGVVIGVTGEWGSGKSSILNLLAKDILRHHPYALVVRFDPWLVSGRDDLVAHFIGQVIGTINASATAQEDLKALANTLTTYGDHLAPFANFVKPGLSVIVRGFLGGLKTLIKTDTSLEALRAKLIGQLNELKLPIVVLIDELDRVEDEEIRSIAQLVRSVVDFPGISYVLAYDVRRVAEALGGGARERGRRYLEKIVQLQIPIPITLEQERSAVLNAEFNAMREELGLPHNFQHIERYEELSKILSVGVTLTLRDVKRLTSTYHALAGMVREEVDWIDLIAYSALLTKSPETVEKIRLHPDDYVEDAFTSRAMSMRFGREKEETEVRWDRLISPNEDDETTRELLRFLFPSLSEDKQGSEDRPESLCFYRPLLTVLKLGLVPGSFTKASIEEFVGKSPAEIAHQLDDSVANDTFANLLERFAELYPILRDVDHISIWRGFAEFVRKPDCEWMSSYTPMSGVIRDCGRILLIATRRNPSLRPLAMDVFASLFNDGEVELTSYWLRQHVFNHGLLNRKARPGEAWFFDEKETMPVIEKASETWRKLHLGGQLLPCHWNIDAAFLLLDSGAWDSECRENLDFALNDHRAVDGLALLLFGGNSTTDASTVAQLCNYERFVERVRTRLESKAGIHETARAALRKAIGEED